MNKRTESAVTTVAGVPEYLQALQGKGESLKGMDKHRILPILAVLQGQSDRELKNKFGEGAIVMYPSETLVQKHAEWGIRFLPVFFWKTWNHRSDRDDAGSKNILGSTMDESNPIAIRATDKARREAEYKGSDGKTYTETWNEVFNFAGVLLEDEGSPMLPVTLQFKGGEHHQGEAFISSQMMRTLDGTTPAEIYFTVWELSSSERTYSKDNWYGIDYRIPSKNPWATEAQAIAGKKLHEKLKAEYLKKALGVTVEAAEAEVGAEAAAEASFEE